MKGDREAPAVLADRRAARPDRDQHDRPAAVHPDHGARRRALRRAHRHPAQQRTAHAGRARHDDRDRHPRHRPLGRRDHGRLRRRRPDDHRRIARPGRAWAPCPSRSSSRSSSRSCSGSGTASSSPCVGIQPIIATLVLMLAGRGVALLITEGFITTVNSAPVRVHRDGLPRRTARSRSSISVAAIAVVSLVERRTALGDADRGRRHQPRGQPARRGARARHRLQRLRRERPARRASRASSTARTSGPPTPTRPACSSSSTRSSPSCWAAPRSWAASSRIAGTVIGVLTSRPWRRPSCSSACPSAQSPVFFATRRHRRGAGAVAAPARLGPRRDPIRRAPDSTSDTGAPTRRWRHDQELAVARRAARRRRRATRPS